jgi:hypothetical protein
LLLCPLFFQKEGKATTELIFHQSDPDFIPFLSLPLSGEKGGKLEKISVRLVKISGKKMTYG